MSIDAIVGEELHTKHVIWLEDLASKEKYIDLVNRLYESRSKSESCLLHHSPMACVSVILGAWLNQDIENGETLRKSFAKDVMKCAECIKSMHKSVKVMFLKLKASPIDAAVISGLEESWIEWNQSRYIDLMNGFVKEYTRIGDNVEEFKRFRQNALFVVFELLRYPVFLKSNQVYTLFIDLLFKIQRGSTLKLADGFFPAVYLILTDRDEKVRNWAESLLRASTSKLLIEDIPELSETISLLSGRLDQLKKANVSSTDISLQQFRVLRAFSFMLQALPKEYKEHRHVFLPMFAHAAELIPSLLFESVFESVFKIYTTIIGTFSVAFHISEHERIEAMLYKQIPKQLMEMSTSQQKMRQALLSKQSVGYLNWIGYLLVRNPALMNDPSDFDRFHHFISELIQEDIAKANLMEFILKPALMKLVKSRASLNQDFFSKLLLACSNAPQFVPLIQDFLRIDLKSLVVYLEGKPHPAFLLHLSVWVSVLESIEKSKTRLDSSFLDDLQTVSLVDPASLDQSEKPKAFDLVAFLQNQFIPGYLQHSLDPLSSLADLLSAGVFLLSTSPVRGIAIEAEKCLWRAIDDGQKGTPLLLVLIQNAESDLWKAFDILMQKYKLLSEAQVIMLSPSSLLASKMHEISLKLHEKISANTMSMGIQSNHSIVNLSSQSISKSSQIVWFLQVVRFLALVLNHSVSWALKTRQNAEIRSLVSQTLKTVAKCMESVHQRNSDSTIDMSATKIFNEALLGLFKWFSTLDAAIKEDAMLVCVGILRFAKRSQIDVSSEIQEKVRLIATKVVSSTLNENQLAYLLSWDSDKVYSQPIRIPEFYSSSPHSNGSDLTKRINSTNVLSKGIASSNVLSASNFKDKNASRTVIPVPKPKKANAKLSKLQQLKSEVMQESISLLPKMNHDKRFSLDEVSIDEIDQGSLHSLAMTISPEKPKRQIKRIDLPHVQDNFKKPKPSLEHALEQVRLGDISNVHKIILRWSFPAIDDDPPNLGHYAMQCIPEKFTSVHSYTSTFEPLVLLECWQHLMKCKEDIDEEEYEEMQLEHATAVDGFYDLQFKLEASRTGKSVFSENDILQITHKNKQLKCLGKVQLIMGQRGAVSFVCRIFPEQLHAMVTVLLPGSIWEGLRLFSLTTMHREYMAMAHLPTMSLCNEILKPNFQKYRPEEKKILDTMKVYKANRPQAEAIVSAVHQKSGFILIQGPPGTGKTKTILSLIGSTLTKSSGTRIESPFSSDFAGKSVGNTGGNFMGSSNAKSMGNTNMSKTRVLCCAPSNAACDEIVRRLKQGIVDGNGLAFMPKIVRLGTSDSIHADVKDVTLELLVEESFTLEYQKWMKKNSAVDESEKALKLTLDELNLERESIQKIRDALNIAGQSSPESSSQTSIQSSSQTSIQSSSQTSPRDLADLEIRFKVNNQKRKTVLEQLTQQRSSKNENSKQLDFAKKAARARVLHDADVVCCTLSAAGNELLSNVAMDFPIVIIDEACQCIELSCLIPLKYGVKKCVLVGDPNQLPPTVLSQAGQKLLYEQSLFQRIMKNVPNAVHLLSIQYRMHPHISALPSLLFYDSKLLDGPSLELQCEAPWHKHPLFAPYRFFNVAVGKEVKKDGIRSVHNPIEAEACALLLESLCASFPSLNFAHRIGVITPYKAQVKKIRKRLADRFGNDVLTFVDVNTVDGFQGQEKDIIILSCVRGGEPGKGIGFLSDIRRMNVALTRAKSSLFVLGNAVALKSNKIWKTLVQDAEHRNMMAEYVPGLFPVQAAAPINIYPMQN